MTENEDGQEAYTLAKSSIVLDAPSKQLMVDTIVGWSSAFPASTGLFAGGIPLFEDSRVAWALSVIGGAKGKSALELGPLEGGHSYMLSRAGASHVTAIEANRDCWLKCLITKEVMNLSNVEFLLGNFMPWLNNSTQYFDIIFAAGILYHLTQPVDLLHMIGEKANAVHIWTHYIPDEELNINGGWSESIYRRELRFVRGRNIRHYLKAYGEVVKTAAYCGGVYGHATWLQREDILVELRSAGFTKIEIAFEDLEHPHGPCFALAAIKE